MEHLILSLLNHYSWINSSGGRLVGGRVPRQDMVMNCLVVLAKGKSCLSYKDQSQRLNREMRHDISRDRETLSQQNTILSEINKNDIASNTRNPEDQCSSPSYIISSTSLSVHLMCTVSRHLKLYTLLIPSELLFSLSYKINVVPVCHDSLS